MEGWVKIHRKLINWEWYKDNNVKIVWLHLLLNANHEDRKWQGIEIKKGQLVTSYDHLAKQTGLTVSQIRTAINKLKLTNEITIKITSKYSLITIEKYRDYQANDEKIASKMTDNKTVDSQASRKRVATNKNEKNEKNEEEYSSAEIFDFKLYEN